MIAIHTALREKGEILQAFLIPKAGILRGGGGGRVKNKIFYTLQRKQQIETTGHP